MIYRAATTEDMSAVQALIDQSDLEKCLAVDMDGLVLVAELQGDIIACVWAMTCGKHAFVDYLIVRNDWIHKGIGIKLMAKLVGTLGSLGVRFVRGVVADDNEEMLKFYGLFGVDMVSNYTYITGDLHGKE